MKVVVMGYHNMGCIGIRALINHGITVPAVITHRDNPNENLWFDSVAKISETFGVPVYYAEDLDNSTLYNLIHNLNPDLIMSLYFRNIIQKKILDIPGLGAVNLHGSLLPQYRGRVPVNWQIINGEKESGVTLHYMVEKPDAGDIIAQKKVIISNEDTALSLFKKLQNAAGLLLNEQLHDVQNWFQLAKPQDEAQATVFKGRKPEDGKIDWTQTSDKIYNLIRAITKPYPGAFSYLSNNKVIIWKAKVNSSQISESTKPPGYIKKETNDYYVKSGDAWLKILEAGIVERNGKLVDVPVDSILKNGKIFEN